MSRECLPVRGSSEVARPMKQDRLFVAWVRQAVLHLSSHVYRKMLFQILINYLEKKITNKIINVFLCVLSCLIMQTSTVYYFSLMLFFANPYAKLLN